MAKALCALLGAALFLLTACDFTGAQQDSNSPDPGETESVTPFAQEFPSPPATPTAGALGTLRYGIAEPDQLIPIDAVSAEEQLIVDVLFDSLTALNDDLRPVPAAAVEWEPVDGDPAHWRFTLREDATFHDGEPVTSADFVAAWNIATARGRAGFLLADVDGHAEVVNGRAQSMVGLSAPDDHILEVRLARPNAEFPIVAAHPALGPIHRDAWNDDETAFRDAPIGNGPFAVAEARAPGQFLRVRRDPGWVNGDGPARVEEVLFQFMDPETAYLAYQQGRLQVAPIPDGAIDGAIDEYGVSVDGYTGPGVIDGITPSLYFLGFNTSEPPFDEYEVRRAISLAIDREAMADSAQGINAVPADSFISPLLRASPASPCTTCHQDLVEARRLFRQHDVNSLRFTFTSEGGHQAIANQLRSDLRAAGVNIVQFDSLPFDEYQAALDDGTAAFFRFGWAPEHPTAADTLRPLFSEGGDYNRFGYASERFERMLAQSMAETAAGPRSVFQYLAEQQIIGRDQVIVPLFFYRHQLIVDERISGFVLDPMGRANLEQVTIAD